MWWGYALAALAGLVFGGMFGFLGFAIVSANREVERQEAEKERLLEEGAAAAAVAAQELGTE